MVGYGCDESDEMKITIETHNPALHGFLENELPKGITIAPIPAPRYQRDVNFHGPLIEISIHIDTWQIAIGLAIGYILGKVRKLDKFAICGVGNKRIPVEKMTADKLIEQELPESEQH